MGVQSCDPLDAVYTEDQEKFLKVYCKRPNNPAAFRRFFDIALEEVEDIDVLSRSAELYREKLKEQYEHLGYLPRPEKWLSDRGWCDYLKASNHYGLSTYVEEEGLAF